MSLYRINKKLEIIHENPFKLEKELQQLCEDNLETIFNLKFVKSEFQSNNFRIDTLGFDNQTKSFVIIEYKKDKNYSVIDQGYAYLALMLNNKADFILEYNENCSDNLKRNDVDWSQSKVIFVSPSFTTYQKEATNFKDLPIELWEARKYENSIVQISQLQTSGSSESIKTISKKRKDISSVTKEIKIYTEDGHLKIADDNIVELYSDLKNYILNLGDDIKVKPTKLYIGFISNTNFVDIRIQKKSLKLWLNLTFGKLNDPLKLARDVSQIGHWGNGEYEISISNDEYLDYLASLIEQSYRLHKK